jgi:hypothetical protein
VRVRTVIAPLPREVEAQIDALDRRLAGIARRYIRRLALEPQLGAPVCRGPLAAFGVRRVYFDKRSAPGDLLRSRAPAARRGDQDLAAGPRWRIVYWVEEAPRAGVRLIVILAIDEAHPRPPQASVYELAWTTLSALQRRKP